MDVETGKDIMVARQQGVLMSEALPEALDDLRAMAKKFGVDFATLTADMSEEERTEFYESLDGHYEAMKPFITGLMRTIYEEVPV